MAFSKTKAIVDLAGVDSLLKTILFPEMANTNEDDLVLKKDSTVSG